MEESHQRKGTRMAGAVEDEERIRNSIWCVFKSQRVARRASICASSKGGKRTRRKDERCRFRDPILFFILR